MENKRNQKKNMYAIDEQGNVHITYDNYDKMVEILEQIEKDSEEQTKRMRYLFMSKSSFPTVDQMEQENIEETFAHFFPFLLFYYEIPQPELKQNMEYKKSIKYLRNLFQRKVQFVDE